MAFIRKNWQKSAGANAVNALMRVGGAGVTAVATNYISKNATGSGLKKTLGNLAAPAMTAIGVMIDLIADNDNIRAFAQGMYTFGALKTASKFITVMGINGIDDENAIMNGAEILNGNEEEEIVYVDEDGNVVSGIGATTETTTSDLPEEIAAAQNGADPNGKAFAEVADYIEQGADNAIQVNGIDGMGDVEEDDYEVAESMM